MSVEEEQEENEEENEEDEDDDGDDADEERIWSMYVINKLDVSARN